MTAGERREQLLDACATIVDAEGFHAATIERVANECGVTRTVVYQQFGGRDGMLDALIERASERAGAAVAAASTDDEPTLRGAMERVLAAVDADPATWRMFLVAPQVGPPALTESLARGRAAIRELNIAAIEQQPGASSGDPELAARVMQVVADELVRLRLADPTVYTTERILAQMDSLAKALLRPRRVRQ
jgi:AcrR family transcriptional regulator